MEFAETRYFEFVMKHRSESCNSRAAEGYSLLLYLIETDGALLPVVTMTLL